MRNGRTLTTVDRALAIAGHALRSIAGAPASARPRPLATGAESPLGAEARKLSGALMRVNHVGEVCAQALYSAQALATPNDGLRHQFEHAAAEEMDHLAWTADRLRELGARQSVLNPIWYAGSFGLGLLAGRAGDAAGLSFVIETERQVERHLEQHLDRLPADDLASRAIVRQMRVDEAEHALAAERAGGQRPPWPIRLAMRLAARVMTTTAHYL